MTALRNAKRALALSLALSPLAPAPAAAEEVLFKCYFDWVCDPNRKCHDSELDLRFTADTETQAITRLGGNPTSEFRLILGDRSVTMIEEMLSGATATTTVQIMDGFAVHSDHHFEGSSMVPMQYLGECVTL